MAIDDFVQPQFDDHLMILDDALGLCRMDYKGYVMYTTQNDWKCNTGLDNSDGLDKYSFSFMNASSHSSIQSNHFLFFIAVKEGLHLSVSWFHLHWISSLMVGSR